MPQVREELQEQPAASQLEDVPCTSDGAEAAGEGIGAGKALGWWQRGLGKAKERLAAVPSSGQGTGWALLATLLGNAFAKEGTEALTAPAAGPAS